MTTPILGLRELAAAQAQPELVLNEALRRVETLLQLTVLDRDLATPPGSPAEGARYIVAVSPTGAWAGRAGQIASFSNGGWLFAPPIEGWLSWVQDEDKFYRYTGTAWTELQLGGGAAQFYGVLARQATPPGSPSDGEQYLVTSGGTGAWLGQATKIAVRAAGVWQFITPRAGWMVYSVTDAKLYTYSSLSGTWTELVTGGGGASFDPSLQWTVPPDPDLVSPFTTGFSSLTSGAGAAITLTFEGGQPGVVKLNPGSTATGHAGIAFCQTASTGGDSLSAGGEQFEIDAYVYADFSTSSSTQHLQLRVGLMPLLQAARPTSGLFFYTAWDGAALAWATSVNGSEALTTHTVTVGWHHIKIRKDTSGNWEFWVDGLLVDTRTGGGPPILGVLAAQCARVGATGTYGLWADYLAAKGQLSLARWA
jgi:hypothetical protein